MDPVSIPPPSNLSSSREPVVKNTISDRLWWNSVADKNPIGTYFAASVTNLSTLASEKPLIWLKTECQIVFTRSLFPSQYSSTHQLICVKTCLILSVLYASCCMLRVMLAVQVSIHSARCETNGTTKQQKYYLVCMSIHKPIKGA